jgi:hypothetical protein
VYSRNLDFDKLLELGARLELELNISVDLVPLEELPPSFKLRILREGIVVVEKPASTSTCTRDRTMSSCNCQGCILSLSNPPHGNTVISLHGFKV